MNLLGFNFQPHFHVSNPNRIPRGCFIACNSSDCFESFSPLNNVVTEGAITTRSNRMKFRLGASIYQNSSSNLFLSSGLSKTSLAPISSPTGGDSSNRGCFGRKTNIFRESGDFAGNRETWEIFREI